MSHPQYGLLHARQQVDGLHERLKIVTLRLSGRGAVGFGYVGMLPHTPQAVDTNTPDGNYGGSVERRITVEPLAVEPELQHRILHGVVGIVGIAQQAPRLADKARPHTSGFFFKTISFHAVGDDAG